MVWLIADSPVPLAPLMPATQLSDQTKDQLWVRHDLVACGPNSIYLLLRMHGIVVPPERIEIFFPSNPKGMSLTEVRDACGSLGLESEVLHCSVSDLIANFPGPVIAYTNPFLGVRDAGHFIVIFAVKDNSIYLLESTTGQIIETTPQKLEAKWRGYVIIPKDHTFTKSAFWSSIVFWALVGCVFILAPWRVFRTRSMLPSALEVSR
jgi:ABC-type bacteriocin/lantibiotic exporter with double-glycine peptidase domain